MKVLTEVQRSPMNLTIHGKLRTTIARKHLIRSFLCVSLFLSALLLPTSSYSQPQFTGNVPTDFNIPNAIIIEDSSGVNGMDIFLPTPPFPAGAMSGNDMKDVRLYYDPVTDVMYVGINTFVIAGDVDGDNLPGHTSAALAGLGGIDHPNFSGSESFALQLDIDSDGMMDVIAGVSGFTDVAGFSANEFLPGMGTPAFSFGRSLPEHTGFLFASPDSARPDLEFTITRFSRLPTSSGVDSNLATFGMIAFIGSFADDGIGEDFLPGVQRTVDVKLAAIGDFVWHDLNGNGIQDVGEPGVPDVVVNVYGDSQRTHLITTDTTDASGKYGALLIPGEYVVEFFRPEGFTGFTTPNAGSNPALDSDVIQSTDVSGWTALITLVDGENNVDIDAGLVSPDFGDAPDPTFPSTLASDGARHLLDGKTFLGLSVDGELDGKSNSTATGDDDNNLADEDGVKFPTLFPKCDQATIDVEASVGGGYLNAWVDYNGNGTWESPDEQIFTNERLNQGHNTLQVVVPCDAVAGNTFARFRFSTELNLAPTGAAADGEVEDYQVEILDPLECAITDVQPPDGTVTAQMQEIIISRLTITGGKAPYDTTCTVKVNGTTHPATRQPDGTFSAFVPLDLGINMITVACIVNDSLNNMTTCNRNLTITRVGPPECEITDVRPLNGTETLDSLVTVIARLRIRGGAAPYDTSCTIDANGREFPARRIGSDSIAAEVPLVIGSNVITILCTVKDRLNQIETCDASITITRFGPPICNLTNVTPPDGHVTADSLVMISARTEVVGGKAPYDTTCTITVNGVNVGVVHDGDGFFSADTSLDLGDNAIVIACTFTDRFNQTTMCESRLTITRVQELACFISELKPPDNTRTSKESITVSAKVTITGGRAPYADSCTIKDQRVALQPDGSISAIVPLGLGDNVIPVYCQVTDSIGQQTVCSDMITVPRVLGPTCKTAILQPADGDTISAPSRFQAIIQHTISGGIPPYLADSCTITVNDSSFAASQINDSTFTAIIPIVAGPNLIIAVCAAADSEGVISTCADTVAVFGEAMTCTAKFISPEDSTFVCGTSATFLLSHHVSGAVDPVQTTCVMNGDTASFADSTFALELPLASGYNTIIATCTTVDSLQRTASCSDTLVVFSDPTPPLCELDLSARPTISGKAFDFESGIASIEVFNLRDGVVLIDSFAVGDKEVSFVAHRTGASRGPSFTLRITNVAGCVIECDPIMLRIGPDALCDYEFTMPHTDRYLQVDNYGLTKIFFSLNSKEILLAADEGVIDAECEVYQIPLVGARTIDLANCLTEGENSVHIVCEGPEGSYAEILIVDFDPEELPTSVAEHNENRDAQKLPLVFELHQNYPNPFNLGTTIEFDVPAGWTKAVRLSIYNSNGQLVKTLIDGDFAPGRHSTIWQGRDESGQVVSSGVYFYRIVSGNVVKARKLTLTK